MSSPKTPESSGAPDFISILRNTLMVGGGTLLKMAIGLGRNKAIAVLLGPAGIALAGIFNQMIEVVGAAFSLGLGTSGIRQIAASSASGDETKLARTVKTLRRTVWISGSAGALFLIFSSGLISQITFGVKEAPAYIWSIALLGVAVLFRALSTGQGCVIQGLRKVNYFMQASVWGAVATVIVTIPCAYWLGMSGVALSVVLTYGATLLVSWWYSRKIPIPDVPCTIADSKSEVRTLIVFGLPIMLSGLVGTISPYIERVILLRYLGLEAMGLYQAAFSLAGVSVTFVLAAMSADYYPKLVAHAHEPERFDREMNAQLEIALLLSIPALAWLAVLSQRAAVVLYSPAFSASGEVLRIMMVGVLGRILAAPLRLALLAKGKGKTIFVLEVVSAIFGFALISYFASHLGLMGCGWAFSALHLGTGLVLAMLLPKLAGQTVSRTNQFLILWSGVILLGLWVNHAYVSVTWCRVLIAIVLATTATVICFNDLVKKTGWSVWDKLRRR
jgi:antigen flippase